MTTFDETYAKAKKAGAKLDMLVAALRGAELQLGSQSEGFFFSDVAAWVVDEADESMRDGRERNDPSMCSASCHWVGIWFWSIGLGIQWHAADEPRREHIHDVLACIDSTPDIVKECEDAFKELADGGKP